MFGAALKTSVPIPHPSIGREAVLLCRERSRKKANSLPTIPQRGAGWEGGGSESHPRLSQARAVCGVARARDLCSGFLHAAWFAGCVLKDSLHSLRVYSAGKWSALLPNRPSKCVEGHYLTLNHPDARFWEMRLFSSLF